MSAFGTFSIVARCPESGALGVAVATGAVGVRSRVPHLALGVGAIATQGYTEIMYGVLGLKLLKRGLEPKEVLKYLLERDAGREYRQVAIIDSRGRKAAHTGRRTPRWSGHRIGANYVVAGNLLRGEEVVLAMEERASGAHQRAKTLLKKYRGKFGKIIATFHPANITGEIIGKASNEAWAAKKIKKLLN